MEKVEKIYRDKFYNLDRPSAYTANIGRKKAAKSYLSKQLAYSLHKPARVRFPRRKIIASRPYYIFQIDLVDLNHLKKYNSKYKFLLTCIDTFSRYAFVRPLKSKNGKEVSAAMESILLESRILPKLIFSDFGREFHNIHFLDMLKQRGIKLYGTSQKMTKASTVERFNRTILARIFRYNSANNTKRYIEALPKLVSGYNNTKHRALKTTPQIATRNTKVYHRLYDGKVRLKKAKLKAGDIVRIARSEGTFTKGYWVNWSDEYFKIGKVLKTVPRTYQLLNIENKSVKGTFYYEQLQKLPKAPEYHRIDRVIRRKGKKLLIHWMNWDSRFDSWINEKDLAI